MQLTKNKTTATAMALFLALTIAATAIALPTANAHTPAWNVPTYAYVAISPNTIGVGQYTQIVMWLDKYPPTATGTTGDRWQNFMVNITEPDGTVTQLGPFTSGPVGSTFTTFTPDQPGDYTIVFYWPGQTVSAGPGIAANRGGLPYIGDFFMASTSAPVILHVQQNPVQQWQESPLPTDYWALPINAANRGWSSLASNWLGGSWLVDSFQSEGQAPNSPHIVWQEPLIPGYPGGIADAQWPGIPYDVNDYENPWSPPIIMNGVIYYNSPHTAMDTYYGYYAVNLINGQQLWYKNGTDNGLNNPVTLGTTAGGAQPLMFFAQTFPQLSFGQLYHYYSLNGNGILSYLWATQGSTWYMIDAVTGNVILTLINVPGGTAVTDQDGSLLRYSYNPNTGNFLCWNSSQAIYPATPTGTGQQQWKPLLGATIDAVNDTIWTNYPLPNPATIEIPWYANEVLPHSGYTMNVTGPAGLPGSMTVLQDDNRVPRMILGISFPNAPTLFGGSTSDTFSAWAVQINYHTAPYSPQPNETNTQNNNLGYTVSLLWNKTYTVPETGNLTWSLGGVSYDDGVWTIKSKETMQFWGFSLTDGSQLWGPTNPQGAFDMYGMSTNVAYGHLYSTGYGGVLYCYDIKTGELLWNYTATNVGFESPYGNYPLSIGAIADGKVYLYSTEHSPTKPLWRGSYVRCVDANNGTELWKIQDFNMGLGVSDGYLVSGNQYNNMIECYGKGPSATTVSTQTTVAPLGSSVLIQGAVTDQSPGASGTPAIADDSMSAWMEYLYMQQPMPTNATGVEVTLDTIDPNGNFVHIGTATSDAYGAFSYKWTPEVPGTYTVIATFAGSASYGSSYAETAVGVSEAPTTTPPAQTTTTQESPMLTYVLAAVIALIIVVIASVILLLRRK